MSISHYQFHLRLFPTLHGPISHLSPNMISLTKAQMHTTLIQPTPIFYIAQLTQYLNSIFPVNNPANQHLHTPDKSLPAGTQLATTPTNATHAGDTNVTCNSQHHPPSLKPLTVPTTHPVFNFISSNLNSTPAFDTSLQAPSHHPQHHRPNCYHQRFYYLKFQSATSNTSLPL